ncbi:hypothetical protein HNP25_000740 [Arcicella rosea]|uniref:Uncharacterized protein n=1 Tax=Arcicella rosea TaxID=502909 RepID=A0A841ERM8_9BACT|nr:hypothetical protein [Arcicella rosea]
MFITIINKVAFFSLIRYLINTVNLETSVEYHLAEVSFLEVLK